MKRQLQILFLWIGVTFSTIAQNEYTSYDGQHFKVGDQLELGYNYITSSKYVHLREKSINQYNRVLYSDLEVGDFPFSKATIVKIIHPDKAEIFSSTNTVFALKSVHQPRKEIFVEIDRAIERGEVITKKIDAPLFANSKEITDELLFACCVRVNAIPVTDEVVLNYIGRIDAELGRTCRSDAFTFQRLKGEYGQRLQQCMDELDFDQLYHAKVRSYHYNYDFDTESYPLAFNQSETNTTRNFIPIAGFNLVPVNIEEYKMLSMPFDQAEQSEKRRKGTGRYGTLDSSLYSIIYFNLVDEKMEIPGAQNSILNLEHLYRNTLVGAKLKGMEVYDHPGYIYNLMGIIKK